MKRNRSRFGLLLLSLVALLAAGEIAGRILGAPTLPSDPAFIEAREWSFPDWIEKDSELLWRYRPSRQIDGSFLKPGRYTINSAGYRGGDFAIPKPDGAIRVVCLGESSTFGLGVTDEGVWPVQLEKNLNALDPQKRRWEVLNLGVTNYSTFQGVRQARREFPRLEPDIVLFCYSWADHQSAANGIPDDRIDMGSDWQIKLVNLSNNSAVWRWIQVGWAKISPPPVPATAVPGFDQRRVPSTAFSENIEKLTREALAVDARPITLTSPISWPPPGQADSSGIFHVHHRYRRLARFGSIAADGEFVELANVFDEHPNFFDDIKAENEIFNAQGHTFAGEFLARYILGDSTLITKYGSAVYTQGR